jgi:vacuolar-type H+-ATPase subunit I/STV1
MSIQRTVTSEIFDPNIQFQQKQLVELTVVDEQSSSPDNALMLYQTLEVIEEQNNAVQEEFAITLKQSQNTILNLQNAQQALLLENAQLRARGTVLESQINQINAAHQADMRAALERNKTLEEALRVKSDEVDTLEKKVAIHENTFSAAETFVHSRYGQIVHVTTFPHHSVNSFIDQLNKTKKQLSELATEKI